MKWNSTRATCLGSTNCDRQSSGQCDWQAQTGRAARQTVLGFAQCKSGRVRSSRVTAALLVAVAHEVSQVSPCGSRRALRQRRGQSAGQSGAHTENTARPGRPVGRRLAHRNVALVRPSRSHTALSLNLYALSGSSPLAAAAAAGAVAVVAVSQVRRAFSYGR